ncbi:MAG TPA: S8 family serine peptidase [Thermoanaerobaculia bacterium]|nr:S8 family serine peptidase [Thermoanaerobaculia bacterium]
MSRFYVFYSFVIGCSIIAALPLFGQETNKGIRRSADPVPGSYIVVLKPSIPAATVPDTARTLAQLKGGRVTAVMSTAIKAFGFRGSEASAFALSRHPLVDFVEEDAFLEFSNTCSTQSSMTTCTFNNDDRWALDRIDQKPPIGSTKSFSYTLNGAGVYAYVVDTGVRGSHDELVGRVTIGANMTVDPEIADDIEDENEEPPIPLDYAAANNPCGGSVESYNWDATHGTAVASVLGGSTVGVARGVTIVPVKVASCYYDPEDHQQKTKVSMLATARGLDWVLSDVQSYQRKAVVNISLRFVLHDGFEDKDRFTCEDGAGGYTNCMAAIEHVVRSLILARIPVVVAAGNDKWHVSNDGIARMGYGGSFADAKTITVGGTMYKTEEGNADAAWVCDASRDAWGGFTKCTRNSGSNYGAAVSIWAPAWNVMSAGGFDNESFRPKGIPSSGTSYAAPQVAGAVARILQKYSYQEKTVDDIWAELSAAAVNSYTPDFDEDPNVENKKLLYASPNE